MKTLPIGFKRNLWTSFLMGYHLVCHPPERLYMKYLYIQNPRHSLKASFGCLLWNSKNSENNLMDCSKMEKSVPLLVLMEPLFFLRKRKMVVSECATWMQLSLGVAMMMASGYGGG